MFASTNTPVFLTGSLPWRLETSPGRNQRPGPVDYFVRSHTKYTTTTLQKRAPADVACYSWPPRPEGRLQVRSQLSRPGRVDHGQGSCSTVGPVLEEPPRYRELPIMALAPQCNPGLAILSSFPLFRQRLWRKPARSLGFPS